MFLVTNLTKLYKHNVYTNELYKVNDEVPVFKVSPHKVTFIFLQSKPIDKILHQSLFTQKYNDLPNTKTRKPRKIFILMCSYDKYTMNYEADL